MIAYFGSHVLNDPLLKTPYSLTRFVDILLKVRMHLNITT